MVSISVVGAVEVVISVVDASAVNISVLITSVVVFSMLFLIDAVPDEGFENEVVAFGDVKFIVVTFTEVVVVLLTVVVLEAKR